MKKHYLLFICFIFVLVILSGCGAKNDKDVIKHKYTFKGENDNWYAEYKMDATEVFEKIDGILTYDNSSSKSLTVTYKGELSDLVNARQVDISYKSRANSGHVTNNYNEELPVSSKEFKITSEDTGSGSALLQEDDVIHVEITIDGISNSIELKTDNDL